MSVRMWEAVAAPGALAELVGWALAAAPAAAVYTGAGDRVVLIDPTGADPGDPPPRLLARPAHSWLFEPVPRATPPKIF